MALTPNDIVEHVNGISDTNTVGIVATNLMEPEEGYGGPYSDETRGWIEKWLAEECSYNRIMYAVAYAKRRMEIEGEFALSTDAGENLIGDNGELIEVYRMS